jgi:hypothetical protein
MSVGGVAWYSKEQGAVRNISGVEGEAIYHSGIAAHKAYHLNPINYMFYLLHP